MVDLKNIIKSAQIANEESEDTSIYDIDIDVMLLN